MNVELNVVKPADSFTICNIHKVRKWLADILYQISFRETLNKVYI